MRRKHNWNGLLVSGMLGAGGLLMLAGAASGEQKTDYSYAAETAAEAEMPGEQEGTLSIPEESESETEKKEQKENGQSLPVEAQMEAEHGRAGEREEVAEEPRSDGGMPEEARPVDAEAGTGDTQEETEGNGNEAVTAMPDEPQANESMQRDPTMETEGISEAWGKPQIDGNISDGSAAETEVATEARSESQPDGKTPNEPNMETEGISETWNENWPDGQMPEESAAETEAWSEVQPGEKILNEPNVETEGISEAWNENRPGGKMPDESIPETGTSAEKESELQSEESAPGEPESEAATEAESTETEQLTEETDQQESDLELPAETELETEVSETETEIQETDQTETEQSESDTDLPQTDPSQKDPAQTEPPQTEPPQTDPPQTEPQPLPIQRGREYEIRGDENAWFRDERDRLWVRAGSNVYVQTLGTVDYGQGGSVTAVQGDGTLTFQLKQVDKNGHTERLSALQKEAYYVDAEAPSAVISGGGEERNGTVYAAQEARLQVAIEPDGKSGLKKAAYCIRKRAGGSDGKTAGQPDIWKDCTDGQQVSIQEEGIWKVYVRTEDQVGNLKFSESTPICVDRTAPEIQITGVSDQSANSGSIPIQISCEDAYYQPGSLKVSIQGANRGKMPAVKKQEESDQGGRIEYFDFPKEQGYDDAYTLTVEASDLAGNRTKKTAEFSVNRFGSVFDLAPDTKKKLKQYYFRHPMDIVFQETNIDYVGASEIFCRENGEVRKLTRGKDYEVTMTGDDASWKQYQYRIPAACFQKEGVYELLLSSRDRASNQSDTGMQGKRVTFALDWTRPECLITGVKDGEFCPVKERVVSFWPQDNLGVRTLKIYKDSELYYQTDAVTTAELPVKIRLSESEEWQTLQAKVCDFAGNESWSPELAVYVNAKEAAAAPYEKRRKSAQEKEDEELQQHRSVLAMQKTELRTALQLSAAGLAAGDVYTAKTGQMTADQMSGEKKGEENSAVAKLQQQERSRRGKLFFGFGGLLFLITAAVCILPVRKRKT